MVQLVGAVLVAAGCAWLGFGAAASLSRRAEGLEDMASALALLERELELGAPPLPALMEELARRAPEGASPMFQGCCQGLERLDEEDFSSLWRRLAAGCDDLGREPGGFALAYQRRPHAAPLPVDDEDGFLFHGFPPRVIPDSPSPRCG